MGTATPKKVCSGREDRAMEEEEEQRGTNKGGAHVF